MTCTVGNGAQGVFQKKIPKIIGTLGDEPLFTNVTTSLRANGLITNPELKHIRAKPSPAEKGNEITQKLLDKIKASNDSVKCLLTICDVFESEDVDNPILKEHGKDMRKEVTSKKISGSCHS